MGRRPRCVALGVRMIRYLPHTYLAASFVAVVIIGRRANRASEAPESTPERDMLNALEEIWRR
jgi:hypothetical protein